MASNEGRGESVGAQAILIVGARVVGAISTAVLTIVLATRLGHEGYGRYALGMTVAAAASTIADLGIGTTTARAIAGAHEEPGQQRAVLVLGLKVKLAVGAVVSLVVVAFRAPIAELLGGGGDLVGVLAAAAVAVFFGDAFAALGVISSALRRAGTTVTMALTKAAVELLVVLVGVVALGFGAVAGVGGNAAGYGVAALIGALLLLRLPRTRARPSVTAREMLLYGQRVWIVGLAWAGFVAIDQLLLGAMSGPGAVGLYDVPSRLASTIQFGGLALAVVMAPRLVTQAQRDGGGSVLFARILRFLIAAYVAIALVLLPLGHPLINGLLAPGFARSGDVLLAILPYVCLMGFTPLITVTLNYIGTSRAQIVLSIVALAIDAGLDLLLIPRLGVMGPAIATDVAFAVYFLGHLILVRRVVPLPLPALGWSLLSGVAAGVPGALAAWGGVALAGSGLVGALAGGAAGALTAAGVLVVLGELDRTLGRTLLGRHG